MTMPLLAINPKYQQDVERAYALVRRYHEIVNKLSDLEEGTRDYNRLLTSSERAYGLFIETYNDLPKRERNNFQRYHKSLHGYEA